MINYRQAVVDPSSVFHSPEEVVKNTELSTRQKIRILHSWEYDARELEVAEEENMQGAKKPDLLHKILLALLKLGDKSCLEHTAPTKQGGE